MISITIVWRAGTTISGRVAERVGGGVEEERERPAASCSKPRTAAARQAASNSATTSSVRASGEHLRRGAVRRGGAAADERLIAHDAAVAEVDDRLVDGAEVVQPEAGEGRVAL